MTVETKGFAPKILLLRILDLIQNGLGDIGNGITYITIARPNEIKAR